MRYVLGALAGYEIGPEGEHTGRHLTTFYVLDKADNWSEVGAFDRLEEAEAFARQLNTDWDRQLAEGISF